VNEAQRQQVFLQALADGPSGMERLHFREAAARAQRGLMAYRVNAQGLADRALSAAFGTVRAMIGAQDFAHLAHEFWLAHPPIRGDLGEWGEPFAHWLEAHAAVSEWPWLGDCARLDLALHQNERAVDAKLDAESLAELGRSDPSSIYIELMPGCALLLSRWPIATIYHAHQLQGDSRDLAFASLRKTLGQGAGEQVLIARDGWRAVVHTLDPTIFAWTLALMEGADLTTCLKRAGENFDFAAWLATALRNSWIKGVAVRA
jgi:Putative DNA-binding domain